MKGLRGKIAGERQVWQDKYKIDMGKQSQEIAELKIKLRTVKIGRVELRAENQSIWNALHEMEQSLVEQKTTSLNSERRISTRTCNMKGFLVK